MPVPACHPPASATITGQLQCQHTRQWRAGRHVRHASYMLASLAMAGRSLIMAGRRHCKARAGRPRDAGQVILGSFRSSDCGFQRNHHIDQFKRIVSAPYWSPTLYQTPASLYPLHIFKNPLAFLPIYLEITDQVEKVEPQAVFLSIKDKMLENIDGLPLCPCSARPPTDHPLSVP